MAENDKFEHGLRDRSRGVQWRRHVTVRVGVRDVAVWKQTQVQTALAACLNFLTEDKWEFEFLPRHAPLWDVEQQSSLIDAPANAARQARDGLVRLLCFEEPTRAGSRLHALHAMEWQFLRLRRALNAPDPWSSLCQTFPEVHRAATSDQELERAPFSTVTARLLRLYTRYTAEWERFPARQHLVTAIAA